MASQNQSLPTKSNNKAYSKTMITILKVKNRDELPRAKQLLANLKPKMKTTSKPYVIVWKVSVLKTISKQEIQLFLHGGRMKCGTVHNTKTGDKNSMNYIKIRYICKYLQRSSIFYYIISILKVKASNFPSVSFILVPVLWSRCSISWNDKTFEKSLNVNIWNDLIPATISHPINAVGLDH